MTTCNSYLYIGIYRLLQRFASSHIRPEWTTVTEPYKTGYMTGPTNEVEWGREGTKGRTVFLCRAQSSSKKRAVVLLNDVRNGKAKFGLNEVNRIADVMFNLWMKS